MIPTILRKSRTQEKKVAKEIDGYTNIASGALWNKKGDVRSEGLLVECKCTGKEYYSLSLSTWNKIFKEATKDGLRTPVMCIDLEGSKYRKAVVPSYMLNSEMLIQYSRIDLGNKKSYRIKHDTYTRIRMGRYDIAIIDWDSFLYDKEVIKGGIENWR